MHLIVCVKLSSKLVRYLSHFVWRPAVFRFPESSLPPSIKKIVIDNSPLYRF